MILKLASRPILLAGEEIQKLAHIHSVLYPNVKQLLRGTFRAQQIRIGRKQSPSLANPAISTHSPASGTPKGGQGMENADLRLTLQCREVSIRKLTRTRRFSMLSRNPFASRKGIFFAVCLVLLGFIGCISIPLGDPEKAKVDDKLLGAWLTKPEEGKQTLFTVVQYDARTCLVSEFEFKKEADKIEPSGRFDWK